MSPAGDAPGPAADGRRRFDAEGTGALQDGSAVPAPLAALIQVDQLAFAWVTRRHSRILDGTMPALSRAADHGLLWFTVAAGLAATGRPTWRRAAVRGTVSLVIASATTNGVAKLWIRRRRPPLHTVARLRRVHRTPVTTSFPSGHSASAAAFAVGAAREVPWIGVPLGALAGAVGLSRVWTGAHYPGDVLIGATLGAAVAAALPGRRRAPRRPPAR
jgi:undecaprenyl-diphosphatase